MGGVHFGGLVAGIWAAGDGVEGIQLTPVGTYQAQVAVADMFNGSRLADYEIVPTAIFTDPELAQVGLTETEAREAGRASSSYRTRSVSTSTRSACARRPTPPS